MEKEIIEILKEICPDFSSYNFLPNDLYKGSLFGGTNVYYKIGKNGERGLITTKNNIKTYGLGKFPQNFKTDNEISGRAESGWTGKILLDLLRYLKSMVISFPAGKTYDLVSNTLIHAHPVKRGYPKEVPNFINLRSTGGYIDAVYEVVGTIECQPNETQKNAKYFSAEIQNRLKQYVETRRSTFGFQSEGKYDYRFYILSLYAKLNPPYQQMPNYLSYTYMSLDDLIINSNDSQVESKEENCPGVWLISANGKMYDHASSFATNGFIDWRQKANYNIGDIVFIYCTKPLMRIMFKCKVVEHSKHFSECVDDEKFWIDKNEYEKSKGGLYARLKLLEQVDTPKLSLEALHNHGLNGNIQGPRGITHSLYQYIDSCFDDFYTEGLFTDVSESEEYHEGHVRSVLVDVYERSSMARSKCIEYHGCACKICGLNFEERYGELGAGFIHVHHLKPLHTIGKDYIVNYKTDLIPVCPNCHAMIHRIPGGESMTTDELCFILNGTKIEKDKKPDVVAVKKQSKTAIPNDTKEYKGKRVIHINKKFGTGIVISEAESIVTVKFDNGVITTFIKDTFSTGMLKIVD